MNLIVEIVVSKSKPFLFFLLLLIFSTIRSAFSQQKSASDSIPSGTRAFNEKVNIGYGFQTEREVSGSISKVISSGFNKGNINDPVQLIQGKVTGLDISKPGGDPNGSYYLRLRGLNTISGNTQPLIVIDGLVEASLNNVDPNDIESITVLKDGLSAAIYGTRGSNGVILVTTKKGKPDTYVVDYNVYTTAEMVARNTPMMNASEWRALNKELGGIGTDYGENTDWFNKIEQTALSHVHNLSMSGGSGKTSYRASVNYRQGEGVEIKTGYTQLNARINVSQKAFNDKLSLDLILGATERESRYGFAEAFRYAAIFNPTAPVMSTDPYYAKYDGYFQKIFFDYYNPVAIIELNKNEGKNKILNLSLKGTYEIFHGLGVDVFYAVQNSTSLGGLYYDKNDYWKGMDWEGISNNGLASRKSENSAVMLFESTAHYSCDITSSLNISALGGYSYQDFINEGFDARGGNFLTDNFTYNNLSAALDFKNGKGTVTSYKNSNKLIAFFGRVNLNINSMWYITACARYDGSSRFGSNNKWGFFPAFGTGIDFAKVINVNFINNLKLRLNYGVTGNHPDKSYLSLQRLVSYGINYYNGIYSPSYSVIFNGNPDLKWEKKGEFDFGIDFSIFKSRLSGSFDYYSRTASDLIFQYYIPFSSYQYYFSDYVWMNIGKIKSSGLELSLFYNVIKKSDFTYSVTLTRSHNLKNTLVSLTGSYNGTFLNYGTRDLGDMGSPGMCCASLIKSEEGKPIGQLQAFVLKEIDENGDMILADKNGDQEISMSDRAVVGNGLPDYLMGLDNEFKYRNWDLDVFFRGVFGHDLVNSYRAFYEVPSYITSYNLPKTAANMRSADGKLLTNTSGVVTNIDIENASFISLDNISLGYNFSLPESSQFSKIRMYLGGNNLFYISQYKGSDPNPRYFDSDFNLGNYNNPLIPGTDRRNTWPRTRSVTFGANVVF